jgi:hypothetical protein
VCPGRTGEGPEEAFGKRWFGRDHNGQADEKQAQAKDHDAREQSHDFTGIMSRIIFTPPSRTTRESLQERERAHS